MLKPYNPSKIFCHHQTWCNLAKWATSMGMLEETPSQLPTPITISVDPANVCNCKCLYCNSDFLLSQKKQCMLSKQYLKELAQFLSNWGVRGACLGGGGESLCNPHTGTFVADLKTLNIGVGMVSNGILLNKFPELKLMDWLGISVDAATDKTWGVIHGVKPQLFTNVLNGMQSLINAGLNVTYKYLIRPENYNEVYDAVRVASSIGCKNFHIRPCADPWFHQKKTNMFTEQHVESVNEQLSRAKQDFPMVNVVGIFNKLGEKQWEIIHPFKKCWGIFATCVFQANGKIGFCCDNRGNPHFEIGPFDHPNELLKFWGSYEHLDMQCGKCFKSCPRCTFKVFNEYFEKCVLNDDFMLDFI